MVVSEHSINAKLLYALLLNRTMLSQKSGWVSEDGNVYVIYTIKQMANDLNRSERTVKTALCELENAGLLTRVRQGLTKANRLFLQIPDGVQLSSPLMAKAAFQKCRKPPLLDGQKLPTSNTDTEYKENRQTDKGEDTPLVLGQYQNVFLSVSQLARLQEAYPADYERTIEHLSEYMEIHGKRYDNHFALIQKWVGGSGEEAPGANQHTITTTNMKKENVYEL